MSTDGSDRAITPGQIPKDKSALRRDLLAQRQGLTPAQWRQKSDRLCEHLRQSNLLPENGTVLAYFSTKQEPDLSPLFGGTPAIPLQQASRQETKTSAVRWGFPRCIGRRLVWHQWSPESALPRQNNRYGIAEPHPDAPQITTCDVDLLLVPAVACDRGGYRLGYGGGFYDRLLAKPDWVAVPTVGILFAEALLPAVPREPWDQPLKMICTDAGLLHRCGAG